MKKCKVIDCDGVHKARGYCVKHYTRFKRHGDPKIKKGAYQKRGALCQLEYVELDSTTL